MAERADLLAEADRRGLLKGEQKVAYDEALRRGLIASPERPPSAAPPVEQSAPRPYNAATDYHSPLQPLTNAIAQGTSGGFVDELASALTAAASAPFSEQTFGEIYRGKQAEQRSELERDREEHPVVSTLGQIAGAAVPVGGGAAVMRAGRNLPNWLKASGVAGTEGAIFGAGTADDNRLASAAAGGAVGAVAGPVVGAIAKPVMTGARNLMTLIGQKVTDTPRRQAERMAANALRDDGVGAPELQRLSQNPALVLADLGENVTGLARGAAAKPGPFRTAASDTLHGRQTGQQSRLIDALGIRGPQGYKDRFDDWAASRITAARSKYDEAYQAPIDVSTPAFGELLNRPAMKLALREGREKLANEGGGQGRSAVAILDGAKRALDDAIGVAQRAGEADKVRILGGMKRQLVAEVDRQVPAYAQARGIFAGEASIRNAAEFGADLFKRRVSHDEARRLVVDMSPSEHDAFRRGALRGVIDMLETLPENRNAAQKLVESTAVRDKLRLLFPDEQGFARFVQTAVDESQMSATRNTVLGGSPTARIQEEGKALTGAGEIMRDVVTGNHLGLFGRFLRSLGYGDVSRETLDELGTLLLTNPSSQTAQRVTRMASAPPPGPISPTTQAATGGLFGALLGTGVGESFGRPQPSRPTQRLAARPVSEDERRRQLLVQSMQEGSTP